MTYQGENDIPTPRQAMAEAVKAANANDPALGRLWLDIATELRVARESDIANFPNRWVESAEKFYAENEQASSDANMNLRTAAVEAFGATAHVPPAAHPRTLEERTQVFPRIAEATVGECRHCHTPIYSETVFRWPQPEQVPEGADPDAAMTGVLWRHRYTQQAACLRPQLAQGDDRVPGAHTFAEPLPADG